MIDRNREAARLLRQIEDELRRLAWWDDQPLPADRFVDMGPFGGRTMAFSQWLQFVFLPAASEAAAGRRDWPNSSDVGTYAVREFDGVTEADPLIALLGEFDALADGPDRDGAEGPIVPAS